MAKQTSSDIAGFYHTVAYNATHRELWRVAGNPLKGFLGSLMKICRIQSPPSYGVSLAPPERIALRERAGSCAGTYRRAAAAIAGARI